MFMQHFIKMMKVGGRAVIVIKNTFLSNGDAASLRKLLLEQCNLHTILDLPSGVFQGAGVKTVVLFFDKGTPTKKIWYYQLNPGRNLGKTNALNEDDMKEFVKLEQTKGDSENSWTLDVSTLGDDCDLSVKNPHKVEEKDERTPAEIFDSIESLNSEAMDIIREELVWDLWPDNNEEGDDLFAEPYNYDDEDCQDELSDEDKEKLDALDAQLDEIKKQIKALTAPLREQENALWEQKELIINKSKS
jgi:type I restriction enzyme M protein